MGLDTLVELAKTSGADAGELSDVPALSPGRARGILIGTGFYGDFMLDGAHRTMGVARWAVEHDKDLLEIDLPVRILDETEVTKWRDKNRM